MKKVLGICAGAALLAGAAAVGYGALSAYVEDKVRLDLLRAAANSPDVTVSIGEIVAAPLENRVVIRDFETTDTSGEKNEEVDVGAVTLSVDEAVITFDTAYFLTPIEEVTNLSAAGIRVVARDKARAGAESEATPPLFVMTSDSMRVEGMGPASQLDGSRPTPVTHEEILAALDDPFHMNFMRMETIDISISESDETVRFDAMEIEGFTEKNLERLELFGFSGTVPVHPDLAELGAASGQGGGASPPPTARLAIASFGMENLDAVGFARFGLRQSATPELEPSFDEIIALVENVTIFFNGLDVAMPDGTRTEIGFFSMGELALDDGMPTRFQMEMTDVRQETPVELTRQSLAMIPIPLGIAPPDVVDSEMSLAFSTDMATDVSRLNVTSFDTFTDVSLDLDVSVGGLAAAKRVVESNLATGSRTNPFAGSTFNGMSLTLSSSARWDAPGTVDGNPSPRLFALTSLRSAAPPTPRTQALLPPVLMFLFEGGTLALTSTPARPLGARAFDALSRVPIDARLETLGVSVTHTPAE
jgi:hypothetical protein